MNSRIRKRLPIASFVPPSNEQEIVRRELQAFLINRVELGRRTPFILLSLWENQKLLMLMCNLMLMILPSLLTDPGSLALVEAFLFLYIEVILP